MATLPYIAPEDVTLREQQIILDFFNHVTTAEEIGDRIEIVGEFDVGERVGERILNARRELGGSFTSVLQIADVPYVGPERFTEIVVVLTGRRPGQQPTVPADVVTDIDSLKHSVATLQAIIGQRYRLMLEPVRPAAFLGQPIDLIATVRDARSNRPAPNKPLVFATTWGVLRHSSGFLVLEGASARARSDPEGRARVQLIPPTYEALNGAQQTALESALFALDNEASRPSETREGLEAFVRKYRIERNRHLRKAVDILFHRARERVTAGLNISDHSDVWEWLTPQVSVYVEESGEVDAAAHTVAASAILPLRIKDWLRAFYHTYRQLLEAEEGSLSNTLNTIAVNNTNQSMLLNQVVGGVHSYVARERGMMAEAVTQSIADRSIQRFMVTRVAELPVTSQVSVLPGLQIAAQSIRASGVGPLAAVTQSSQDLRLEVEQAFEPLGNLDEFTSQLNNVQGQLASFESNFPVFQSNFAQFQNNYQTFSTDFSFFQDQLPIILPPGPIDPGIGGGGIVGGGTATPTRRGDVPDDDDT